MYKIILIQCSLWKLNEEASLPDIYTTVFLEFQRSQGDKFRLVRSDV
jgi:hypothetical protein